MFFKLFTKTLDFITKPSRRIVRVALDEHLVGTAMAWAILLYDQDCVLACVPISSRESTHYPPLGLEFRMLANGGKRNLVIETPTTGYRTHVWDWFHPQVDVSTAPSLSIHIIDLEPDTERLKILGNVMASGFRGIGP